MHEARTDSPASGSVRPARAMRWLPPLLALLLLPAIGGAFWRWNSRLPGASSSEVTFARDMAAHHEQAVEMALILLERAVDPELRTVALDIVLTQQAQIGQMQGWLGVWGIPIAGPEPPMAGQGLMMGLANEDEVEKLRTLPAPDTETLFLQLMIRHHQGGVMMASQALGNTRRPEVVRLATAIRNSQQSEIDYMTKALQRRGAPLPAPVEPMPNHTGAAP